MTISVFKLISNARAAYHKRKKREQDNGYVYTKFLNQQLTKLDNTIDHIEDVINESQNSQAFAINKALEVGFLRRGTSGRLYIQLA